MNQYLIEPVPCSQKEGIAYIATIRYNSSNAPKTLNFRIEKVMQCLRYFP